MNVTFRATDPSLPPSAEFESMESWLHALPPYTVLLQEFPNGVAIPVLAEDVIDGLAMAPIIRERLRQFVEEDDGA